MKPFMTLKLKALPPVALTVLLVTAGCGRDAVKVYNVDTNDPVVPTPPSATAPASQPGGMGAVPPGMPTPDESTRSALKFVAPTNWLPKPAGEMRVASFDISDNGKKADVSVVPLGGTGGGDLANVNRWRGQVGQGQLTEEALQKTAEKISIAGQPAALYDLAPSSFEDGTPSQRILGAILHTDGMVWFFKMTGDDALVQQQKPAFLDFLKSVKLPGAPAAPDIDLSKLPPSHPPIGGMGAGMEGMGGMNGMPVTPPDPATVPTWDVPADWKPAPVTQFVVAKFALTGQGGAATVSVSSLGGDGGGLLSNVNRWRQQLGQDPVDESALAKLDTLNTPAGNATVVDITGVNPSSGQPARMVGVVLGLEGRTWFYKFTGDSNTVSDQKQTFLNFVKSAKYPANPAGA